MSHVKWSLLLYSNAHGVFTFMNSFDGIRPGKSFSGWGISAEYAYPPNIQVKFLFGVVALTGINYCFEKKKTSKHRKY